MMPYEYPLAMMNGAAHHSRSLATPAGDFPKEMKSMSHATLNRNAPNKEVKDLVNDTMRVFSLYLERMNEDSPTEILVLSCIRAA